MATSSVRSSSQPLAASMASWSLACSARSFSIAASSMGSPSWFETSLNRSSTSRSCFTPSSTLPFTSSDGSSCGSWGRNPTRMLGSGRAVPKNSASWPAMMRSSVDLPAPLGPMTPIFAPGKNDR